MSLKIELKNIILERGVVTLKEIEDYCHQAQYKLSNAERRLRELRGIVEPIYNEKKTAIVGYKKYDQIREEDTERPLPQNYLGEIPRTLSEMRGYPTPTS